MQDTIGASDGRMYDVVIEILDNTDLMVAKSVLFHMQPRQSGEQPLGFRINYFRQFLLRRPLVEPQLIVDARGEVVMYLEGNTEDWENPQRNAYTLNKL